MSGIAISFFFLKWFCFYFVCVCAHAFGALLEGEEAMWGLMLSEATIVRTRTPLLHLKLVVKLL